MDALKRYVREQLAAADIRTDHGPDVERLAEEGIICEDTPPGAAYTTFLVRQAARHPVFGALLKRQHPFDISLSMEKGGAGDAPGPSCEETEGALRDGLRGRCEYVFAEDRGGEVFAGIRLSDGAHRPLDGRGVRDETPAYLVPYALVLRSLGKHAPAARFHEHIFEYAGDGDGAGVEKAFAELIGHLRSIPLPLSIASYDLLYARTSILPVHQALVYMGASRSWPADPAAQDCVRTAMYCQYYSKCPYSAAVGRGYVLFRYRDTYFRVQILAEEAGSPRHRAALALQARIGEQPDGAVRKARMARQLLGSLGFYPLVVDDFLVDCVALVLGRGVVGDARFVESLLGFDWDLRGKHLSLDTLRLQPDHGSALPTLRVSTGAAAFHCPLPRSAAVSELRTRLAACRDALPAVLVAGGAGGPVAPRLPGLDPSQFDFVLSTEPRDGFKEIVGAYASDLALGTPDPRDFVGRRMHREATFYYDPCDGLLYVRVSRGHDPELVAKVVISETSFGYVRMGT